MITEIISLCIASYFINGCASRYCQNLPTKEEVYNSKDVTKLRNYLKNLEKYIGNTEVTFRNIMLNHLEYSSEDILYEMMGYVLPKWYILNKKKFDTFSTAGQLFIFTLYFEWMAINYSNSPLEKKKYLIAIDIILKNLRDWLKAEQEQHELKKKWFGESFKKSFPVSKLPIAGDDDSEKILKEFPNAIQLQNLLLKIGLKQNPKIFVDGQQFLDFMVENLK